MTSRTDHDIQHKKSPSDHSSNQNVQNRLSALTRTMAAEAAKKGASYFPLGGEDVKPPSGRATATCYCGGVRLEFVRFVISTTTKDGILTSLV